MAKGKKSKDYSYGSYDDYNYDADGTWFRTWGNDCCVGWQRIFLFVTGVLFFIVAVYQASHAGDYINRNMKSTDSTKANAISSEVILFAEGGSLVSAAAAVRSLPPSPFPCPCPS